MVELFKKTVKIFAILSLKKEFNWVWIVHDFTDFVTVSRQVKFDMLIAIW